MTDTYTDANGLQWLNGGAETDDHLAFGGHEPAILQIAKSLLPENGTFLDIGAHVGLYTLNLAFKAKRVICWEANKATYEVLTKNIKNNIGMFPNTDFHLFDYAAWDSEAILTLVDEKGFSTGGSTRCVESADGPTVGSAKAYPIDQKMPYVLPDLVKIDVEGAEAHVLRGMRETVRRCAPVLLIEMHDMYWGPQCRTETIEFLESEHYDWDDSLTFSESYYIIAKPKGWADPRLDFEPEVVKRGKQQ